MRRLGVSELGGDVNSVRKIDLLSGADEVENKGNIYLHVIDEGTDKIIMKRLVASVPRPNDEIRIGGAGNERYYKITRVVWVFDEDNPWQRVNIGAELCT